MTIEEFDELMKTHPELRSKFQYMAASHWRGPYYRLRPEWYKKPTRNNKVAMLALAETSYNAYGMKGYVMQPDGILPVVSAIVRQNLSGKKLVRRMTPFEKFQRFMMLRARLEAFAQTPQ